MGPKNLHVVWERGDKSFVEVLKNHKKQIAYKEGDEGQQLPEQAFAFVFQIALGLARANPNDLFLFTRYDLESATKETSNNKPHKMGLMGVRKKTIYMFGMKFRD